MPAQVAVRAKAGASGWMTPPDGTPERYLAHACTSLPGTSAARTSRRTLVHSGSRRQRRWARNSDQNKPRRPASSSRAKGRPPRGVQRVLAAVAVHRHPRAADGRDASDLLQGEHIRTGRPVHRLAEPRRAGEDVARQSDIAGRRGWGILGGAGLDPTAGAGLVVAVRRQHRGYGGQLAPAQRRGGEGGDRGAIVAAAEQQGSRTRGAAKPAGHRLRQHFAVGAGTW